MQGIIGAFLGFLISFLLSVFLLNQPSAFQKVPELVRQPIYFIFIGVGTLAGMLIGYLCKSNHFSAKKEYGKEGEIAVVHFNDSLADTIVTVTAIFYGFTVLLLNRGAHYIFIFLVLLLWFLFRKVISQRKNLQSDQTKATSTKVDEKESDK